MKILPCIIGLGYVGLPITLNLSSKLPTFAFDINKERIEKLKKNKMIIESFIQKILTTLKE